MKKQDTCVFCGEPAKEIACNVCKQKISICSHCAGDWINTDSECVCPDCQRKGGKFDNRGDSM